jgi:hypothetical protein
LGLYAVVSEAQKLMAKIEYIIKRMHWEGEAEVLARLQALYDNHLSLQNEMIRALQRAGNYGNHGGTNKPEEIEHAEDQGGE